MSASLVLMSASLGLPVGLSAVSSASLSAVLLPMPVPVLCRCSSA
jgi:hypothetical protein